MSPTIPEPGPSTRGSRRHRSERERDSHQNIPHRPQSEPANNETQIPTQERLLSPNELSYHLPSRAYGMNDMYICMEFLAPQKLITPARVQLAWAIIRLRHPLIASFIHIPFLEHNVDELDYTAAKYVYDPPHSPARARDLAAGSLSLMLDPTSPNASRDGSDLAYTYNNGPRILSPEQLSFLTITASSAIIPSSDGRGKFFLFLAATHSCMDGISIYMLGNELFELLGAAPSWRSHRASSSSSSSSQHDHVIPAPRNEVELMTLLRAEWAIRYGAGSELGQARRFLSAFSSSTTSLSSLTAKYLLKLRQDINILPPSLEARLKPFANTSEARLAREDFLQDQVTFIGGHSFPRRRAPSPPPRSSRRHSSSPRRTAPLDPHGPPYRNNITRDIVWSETDTKMILKRCKANGVSVQNALFAACNLAWCRIIENKKQSQALVPAQAQEQEQEKVWPTLMYTAANLRPRVGTHAYKTGAGAGKTKSTDVVPPSPAFVALGYFNVMLPGDTTSTSLSQFSPASSSSSSSPSSSPLYSFPSPSTSASSKQSVVEQGEHIFWARARSAKEQAAEALGSPMLLSRSVIMAEERGARAVKFAKEDDGVTSSPPPPYRATPTASPSASIPIKKSKAPSMALMGLSLLGSIDGLYKTTSYPLISILGSRCGTRKAHGGLLLFSWSLAGRLYVSLGWDETSFVGRGEKGGVEEFLDKMRGVVGDFMLGSGDIYGRGEDVSGSASRGAGSDVARPNNIMARL